jgi:hypothetical protein
MRKLFVAALSAGLIAGLAAPAQAAERTHYESSGANAYWNSRRVVRPGVVDRTTWYVGIYAGTEGVWSDAYKDTVRCVRLDSGKRRCRLRSSLFGVIEDLGDGTFTIDADGLTVADLDVTYPLQQRDPETFDPVGEVVPTHIVTHWEGIGDLDASESKSSYKTDCYWSRSTDEYRFRGAEATGTVRDKLDLGETYNGYLSWSSSTTVYQDRCEDEGGEPTPRPIP